jgi:hypothetical protein
MAMASFRTGTLPVSSTGCSTTPMTDAATKNAIVRMPQRDQVIIGTILPLHAALMCFGKATATWRANLEARTGYGLRRCMP